MGNWTPACVLKDSPFIRNGLVVAIYAQHSGYSTSWMGCGFIPHRLICMGRVCFSQNRQLASYSKGGQGLKSKLYTIYFYLQSNVQPKIVNWLFKNQLRWTEIGVTAITVLLLLLFPWLLVCYQERLHQHCLPKAGLAFVLCANVDMLSQYGYDDHYASV